MFTDGLDAAMKDSPSFEHRNPTSPDSGLKTLARLFANATSGNNQGDINPRNVLLGLSAFFKSVAMASEGEEKDVELGVCGSQDEGPGNVTLSDSLTTDLAGPGSSNFRCTGGCPDSETGISATKASQKVFEALLGESEELLKDAEVLIAAESPMDRQEFNPRQFLRENSYTELEIDVLGRRGKDVSLLKLK